MQYSLLSPSFSPATRPLRRVGRWLIYGCLLLAGAAGYGCGVSCTRPRPATEAAGPLVAAPRPVPGPVRA